MLTSGSVPLASLDSIIWFHHLLQVQPVHVPGLPHQSGCACAPVQAQVKEQVRREIETQQNFQHPNVLYLYGYFHDKGGLYKQLTKHGLFSERRSAVYIDQMANALSYLLSKHVIHRDIKPENLLVGINSKLKIGNVGLWLDVLDYLPPEMVKGHKNDEKFFSANGNPPIAQHQTAFKGHDLIGLDFSSTGMLKVGGLHVIDWFDDCSLYLLKVPSHTPERICEVLLHGAVP
ncbi:kinase-like domain-containing protein [Lactarius psammicola]|nr:kinase-like domain-containing protein [Lactarius psammicola]